MRVPRLWIGVIFAAGMACVVEAQTLTAQVAGESDHTITFELGWAADWSRQEGTRAAGGTFAFEVTPIEHWLELEVGATAIHAPANVEASLDVLFKKPWRVSPRFEFMIGVGPELIHETRAGGGTHWGLSAVADLMFWPRRNVGWYLEPGYEAGFQNGATRHGLAVAAGLLIGR
jgi:hypothetical protein